MQKYYYFILLFINLWLVSLNDESFTEEHAAILIRNELMKQVKVRNSRKKENSKKSNLFFGGGSLGLGRRRFGLGGGLGAFSSTCGGGGAFGGLGYRGIGGFGGPFAGAFPRRFAFGGGCGGGCGR